LFGAATFVYIFGGSSLRILGVCRRMIDWFLLDVDWNRYMDRLPNNDLLVNGNLDRDRVRSGDMDCLVYRVWVGYGTG